MDVIAPSREGAKHPDPNPRLLVVDDNEAVRATLALILRRSGYACETAAGALEAKAVLQRLPISLVLTDMNMPRQSGMDLIGYIAERHPETATIMVTAVDDRDLAEKAIDVGAYGYVIKPFEPNEILISVISALRQRRLELESRARREQLQQSVKSATGEFWTALGQLEIANNELRASREETIRRLSIAVGFRDDETAAHIRRMSHYCDLLAEKLGWDAQRRELMRLASATHDVGKIGIPDAILLKPRRLTPEEFDIIKTHTMIGHRILAGSKSELLQLAAVIAVSHHERFDGSGYPEGLAGDDIPVEGRVAAIADVFNALTTDRIYRKAFNLPDAVRIMKDGRGTNFEPDLLDLFLDNLDAVLRVKDEEDRQRPAR
ncbi:MAG: HD domain-containing phosphohydrolase [Actinomycetota bacterium]